jgi:hypothetical protein
MGVFSGKGALDPQPDSDVGGIYMLTGAIQVCRIVLTEHLCACLKGQCHEVNIFLKVLLTI